MRDEITLLIKGNGLEAQAAASKRGVPLLDSIKMLREGEVVAYTTTEHFTRVAQWLHEPPHEPPFPVGSLLWFKYETGKGSN